MIVFPNAKINIGLNITERRPDGYHNLETIFYPLMIKDALEVVDFTELKFQSSGIDIPGDAENNLCLKAYHLLKKDFDFPPVSIHLHKHIPIGAGLGGGSADAAFFIKLLNQQFSLNLSADAMMAYVRKLGADCAFFINNQAAYAFERGDHFEPVTIDLSSYYIVLVMPPVHVSTAQAFSRVKPEAPKESLRSLVSQPIENWKHHIKNDFETSVFAAHPSIRLIKEAFYDAGAIYASMTGSGASVFGIFRTVPDLQQLKKNNQVFVVSK
jgi:4-diphosphocytidyl-2-C-methyl-D-erythritol kinase